MSKFRISLFICFVSSITSFAQKSDSLSIRTIFSETLENGKAYEWLYDLTENIGGRLAGSPQAAKAVEWAKNKMIEAGADTVYLEPVMVPHWIRGEKEKGFVVESSICK